MPGSFHCTGLGEKRLRVRAPDQSEFAVGANKGNFCTTKIGFGRIQLDANWKSEVELRWIFAFGLMNPFVLDLALLAANPPAANLQLTLCALRMILVTSCRGGDWGGNWVDPTEIYKNDIILDVSSKEQRWISTVASRCGMRQDLFFSHINKTAARIKTLPVTCCTVLSLRGKCALACVDKAHSEMELMHTVNGRFRMQTCIRERETGTNRVVFGESNANSLKIKLNPMRIELLSPFVGRIIALMFFLWERAREGKCHFSKNAAVLDPALHSNLQYASALTLTAEQSCSMTVQPRLEGNDHHGAMRFSPQRRVPICRNADTRTNVQEKKKTSEDEKRRRKGRIARMRTGSSLGATKPLRFAKTRSEEFECRNKETSRLLSKKRMWLKMEEEKKAKTIQLLKSRKATTQRSKTISCLLHGPLTREKTVSLLHFSKTATQDIQSPNAETEQMVEEKRQLRKLEYQRLRQKVQDRRNKVSAHGSGSMPFRFDRARTPMFRNAEDMRIIEGKKECQMYSHVLDKLKSGKHFRLKEDEKVRARIAAQRQGTATKIPMWHCAKEWSREYRTRNADSEHVIALKRAAQQKRDRERFEQVRARQEKELCKSLPARHSLRAAGSSILQGSKPWRHGRKVPSKKSRPSKRRTSKFPLLSYA
eukprot:jgi/Bigna1/89610/estExt_fgenesh1_pg.C_520088